MRIVTALREGQHSISPFHWQIEFPEVFTVDAKGKLTGGFDAIVGNPPFAGKNTLINSNRDGYLDWLKAIHEESHGNADLVAHFFRRAFNQLRRGGCFGLIATNTIGQGDTRNTGLRWICTHGGTIYEARRRYKWPGVAAVVVSVVHVCRGEMPGPRMLDGRAVEAITAFLFHGGGHDDPARLEANAGKSFQGSIVLGMGFTFDDSDTSGVANPISLMRELIEKDPRNAERILPYLGGEEVNTSPTHAHHRYVINFGEMPLRRERLDYTWDSHDADERRAARRKPVVPLDYPDPVAADWPELLAIVEAKVRPDRLRQNDIGAKEKWWQYIRPRPELHAAIADLERVLVNALYGPQLSFLFLNAITVFANKLNVMPFDQDQHFAVLQSRSHEVWARFFSSTLKDDLAYAPSDCFETFPFPVGFEANEALEAAGREYYDFRAALMVRNDEGLTKTYNRFHDPDERSAEILQLRELHAAMDRAVLEAYGWHDLAETATCDFLLDYEDEEDDEEESSSRRRRRKPWRYRWPDDFRDEVLARLLALNAHRAEEERLTGAAAEANAKSSKPTRKKNKPSKSGSTPLFEE